MNELRHFNSRRVILHKILKSSLVVAVKKNSSSKISEKQMRETKDKLNYEKNEGRNMCTFIYLSVCSYLLVVFVSFASIRPIAYRRVCCTLCVL